MSNLKDFQNELQISGITVNEHNFTLFVPSTQCQMQSKLNELLQEKLSTALHQQDKQMQDTVAAVEMHAQEEVNNVRASMVVCSC